MKWPRLLAGLLTLLPGWAWSASPPATLDIDRVVAVEDFDHELLAREIFHETNAVRGRHGVAALKGEAQLTAAANEQAAMLSIRLHSGHDNPLAKAGDPHARVTRAGLAEGTVAENVATVSAHNDATGRNYTYHELAVMVVQEWMDSAGHRVNLLNPKMHFLGCGTRAAWALGNPAIYAVQDFYTPAPRVEPPPPAIQLTAPRLPR